MGYRMSRFWNTNSPCSNHSRIQWSRALPFSIRLLRVRYVHENSGVQGRRAHSARYPCDLPVKEGSLSSRLEHASHKVRFRIIYYGDSRSWIKEPPLESWWIGAVILIDIDLRLGMLNRRSGFVIQLLQRSLRGPLSIHVYPFEQMPQRSREKRMLMIGDTLMSHIKIAPAEQVGSPAENFRLLGPAYWY
jgi:hypothetical protein